MMIAAALTLVSCNGKINRKFAELDREIELADSYMDSFRHRADSLESRLDEDLSDSLKWELCYDLFSSFIHLNLDSTVRYCDELERYASNSDLKARTLACKLNCMRLSGSTTEMDALKDEVDPSKVSPDFLSEYYFHITSTSRGPSTRSMTARLSSTSTSLSIVRMSARR